jgi:hypothetical protein
MNGQQKNEKVKIRTGEWLMIIFTFGIFATGLVAAFIFYCQLGAMKTQLKGMESSSKDTHALAEAAKVQADAAKTAAEAALRAAEATQQIAKKADENIKATRDSMRLDQRAWVVVKDVKFENKLKADEVNRFSLTFLNVGKTPANHVGFKYTSRVHMPGKPDIVTPVPSDEYEDLSLGPGTKFIVYGNTLPPILNQADIDGLESGTIVLTLSVEVTYQDVFGGGKSHKTAYCGFYKPENKPDFTICNSGNYME